jgi:D-3-phosphoglycerate dehydrogenase / 2-oxoglutarate reductase
MTRAILVTGPTLADSAVALATRRDARVVMMKAYGTAEEIAEQAAREQADAIIVRAGGRVAGPVYDKSGSVKIVVKHGVGVETIDLAGASQHKIPVMIAVGANALSVAEQALALMFAVAKSLSYLDRRIRDGHWDKATYVCTELTGRSLGVVGLGNIGRTLISLVQPLKMSVHGYDPQVGTDADIPGVKLVGSVDELMRHSDVLSLHAPLTPQTRHMIGRAQLAMMKPGSIIINTARGGLIDTEALIETLKSGQLLGAGLDTFEEEPPPKDSPLWALPNVALSPHVGANTDAAMVRVAELAVEQALDFLDGLPVDRRAVVNPDVLAPDRLR